MTFLMSCLALCGWVYLAFFNGEFWKLLFDETGMEPETWPAIDIIIPARDEAEILPHSLPSLLVQDYRGAWRILLVDDHSEDGTGALAQKLAADAGKIERLTVIQAPDLPQGWTGKVAAMQAGVAQSSAEYILFTDADIAHPPDSLRRLAARAVQGQLDLVSRMVKLHCQSTTERLLIPAFVFFFAMLYPFRRANDPERRLAAAAGGVMLVRRKALNNIGGLSSIRSAMIDDCALAKAIKHYGGADASPARIELTLTHDIRSLRPYPKIMDVWRMVARTAYTQLRRSPLLLAGTVIGLCVLFLAPVLLFLSGHPMPAWTGFAALVVMIALYLPLVHFYDLSFLWAFTLPLAALIYIAATVDSALLYWQGRGGQWKGRTDVGG